MKDIDERKRQEVVDPKDDGACQSWLANNHRDNNDEALHKYRVAGPA